MAKIPVGIQLYTVRQSLDLDFKGTLKQLAEMGYKGVEFAGNYGNMEPAELAAFLKELGLKCCGQHVSANDIGNPEHKVYAYAKALRCPYLTTSGAHLVEKDWAGTIEVYRKCGATAKSKGCMFTYHNHAQEFKTFDGVYAEDMLLQKTDPTEVFAELDTFWIRKGGPDPVAYIAQYAGRVPQIHLKDMNPLTCVFTEVGNGLMDLKAIFKIGKKVGAKWVIVEQDTCPGPELESARTSITNLKLARLA
ncbi:MAG: sugar phosphate isomerase/epimerase [Kiritimatiellia bacterium]